MLTLEQVKQLEARVKKAVDLIDSLREENSVLKGHLEKSESRLKELEKLVDGFRNDQDQIEQGIKDVLEQLNSLEDSMYTEQSAEEPARTVPSVETPPTASPSVNLQAVPPHPASGSSGFSSPPSYGEDSLSEDDFEEPEEDPESAGQLDIF